MRKVIVSSKGKIKRNKTYEGISIEEQLRRKNEGEAIEMNAQNKGYNKAEDGIPWISDIRTDKLEIARQFKEAEYKSKMAATQEFFKKEETKGGVEELPN